MSNKKSTMRTKGNNGFTFSSTIATVGVIATLVVVGAFPLLQSWFPMLDNIALVAQQTSQSSAASASSSESANDAQEDESQDSESTSSSSSTSDDEGSSSGSSSESESSSSGSADDESDDDTGSSSSSSSEAGGSSSSSSSETESSSSSSSADTSSSTTSSKTDADKQETRTLKGSVEGVDGTRYNVTIEYDEEAAIPEGAELTVVQVLQQPSDEELEKKENKDRPYDYERFVGEDDLEKYDKSLKKALEVDADNDEIMISSHYVDLAIMADGAQVQPAAPVKATVKTNAVSKAESDAVEASFYTEKNAESLALENESTKKDGAVFSFETEVISDLGLAVVVSPRFTWGVEDTDLLILGGRSAEVDAHATGDTAEVESGQELYDVVQLEAGSHHDFDTTLWLKTKREGGDDSLEGGLATYIYDDGELTDQLFAAGAGQDPVSVKATEKIALVWDAYRDTVLELGEVTLEGSMPDGAEGKAQNVTAGYADPSALLEAAPEVVAVPAPEGSGDTGAEDADTNEGGADDTGTTVVDAEPAATDDAEKLETIAAYDISIAAGDEGYQPTKERPVTVSITDAAIKDAEGLQVWHILDDGTVEVIEGITVDGDTVTFEAPGFSTYMVLSTVRHQTLTASDGNEYKVTVSYDTASGIPDNAELSVSEINESDAGYKEYVEKTADALGEKPENLSLARAFDITLKNPTTGEEYQPNKDVAVSIELLNDSLNNYENVDVVHINGDSEKQAEVVDSAVKGEAVEFVTSGFSVYVVTGYTVDFHWGEYTYNLAGQDSILLSELIEKLGVKEITLDDVTSVSFSNPNYVAVEQTESDWLLKSLAPFDTEETLTLTLSNGQSVEIKVTDEQGDQAGPHNPKVSMTAGNYDAENKTITYTVTVEAEGDMDYVVPGDGGGAKEYPVVIESLTNNAVSFVSGSYTYTHKEGFSPSTGKPQSKVNNTDVTTGATEIADSSLTIDHMYDGDKLTLTYEAKVVGASYDKNTGKASTENKVTITNKIGEEANPKNNSEDDTASATTSFNYTPLAKEISDLEGSWATWTISVNPNGLKLDGGNPLTLEDTFTKNQSIDYSSVEATSGVSFDYSGTTGTFVIPDGTAAKVSYRTRVAAQQPGDNVEFGNTAKLFNSAKEEIQTVDKKETHIIYPSASDVATTTGVYMVRFFVYGDANMQTGIPGAQFVLLDENHRPMTYKLGDNAGELITFTTDSTGYVDVKLDGESGGVSIEKNTQYYMEMIKAPEGYTKDNGLYGFVIKDNPDYSNYEYYNGDTLKVRLYPEAASLNVSMRFSGNYSLTAGQQNDIKVILEKKNGADWETLESHSYSEFNYGSLTFDTGKTGNLFEIGETYRVREDGEKPWNLPSDVSLNTSYYLMIGSGNDVQHDEPQEFTVTEANVNSSFNVIINNEYERHELTITKMDKETGAKLPGAVFTAKKAKDDSEVRVYTADNDGVITISGGSDYESELLYYVVETTPPTGYLLPLEEERIYFYFCNDPTLEPSILKDLPAGETAVNLTKSYDSRTLDNQKEKLAIPVMKTWQGNDWPNGVHSVVIGLYQSKGGAEPTAVKDEGQPRTVTLTKQAPYNNSAFTDLPSRVDGENVTYSIKEEHIFTTADEDADHDIISQYVQEYGISDAGVYVVRNSPATTLTVTKKWFDGTTEVNNPDILATQSPVTFDLYRTTTKMGDDIKADGITVEEMEAFVSSLTWVRRNQSFGSSDSWQKVINDIPKEDDLNNKYYYYILETVPSFGTEIYEVNEQNGTATIKNQVAPNTVNVTVKKAALVNDPRDEAKQTDFSFTLALKKGTRPIRSYQVYADSEKSLVTDWDGEVTFTLKPENSIALSLPVGVEATITEAAHPEYIETADSEGITNKDTDNGRVFRFDVVDGVNNKAITYTNKLRVICKVVDKTGEAHVFESFNSAFTYIRANTSSVTAEDGTITIQMLDDYVMPATDVFGVHADENIILTTATTNTSVSDGFYFPFNTVGTGDRDTAIITRGGAGGSMLTNAGSLKLDKVTLDGAKDASYTISVDGGLVNNAGTLELTGNTTLRNSSTNVKGGAIYSTGTINMSGGSITGGHATNGSAIYLASGTLNMTGGSISGNTSEEDGAVVPATTECKINLSGNPVIFGNKNSSEESANIYLDVDSDNVINVCAPGLGTEAQIGVWAMETHREIGEQFATSDHEMTANLDHFVNDLYEYRGKVKDGTSTNVVWDGLTLTLNKAFDSEAKGANPNDTFTITLSSTSIKKKSYTIDGNLDYTVTPARGENPGTIELRKVKAGNSISIQPLPVGDYTITEASSNYTPSYSGTDTEAGADLSIDESGNFSLKGDSTVTVTNTRRLASVDLTKTLEDRLVGDDEAVDFGFTVKLTDEDGTAIKNYTLAEASGGQAAVTTGDNGEATLTLSPKTTESAARNFMAPVGATMSIAEDANDDYSVTVYGRTAPSGGEGVEIEDGDADNANIFTFPVTDDGASVTFANVRKMAVIDLSKVLKRKVSETESFNLVITLTREDELPAVNYEMYKDPDPTKSIITNDSGQAFVTFEFGKDDETVSGESSKSVELTIPFGTELKVAEEVIKKPVDGTDQEIYDTEIAVNGEKKNLSDEIIEGKSYKTYTIDSVSEADRSIAFTNPRKTREVTVSNTVNGYAGNVVPFTYTATVTGGNGYNEYGFENGVQTFELTAGQHRVLTVPYGAELSIAETYIVGYKTTIKHGNTDKGTMLEDRFTVSDNVTVAFTNEQLIGLQLKNETTSTLSNVRVDVEYGKEIYRVNPERTNQDKINEGANKYVTLDVEPGETVILEITHQTSATAEQTYIVSGTTPSVGYYYTINNEPSFHEFAEPAVLRVYDVSQYEVKGKLRYSVSDSIVTFAEQPLVSFDANGGAWTTEMEGYRDPDGTRKVYQMAVDSGKTVARPNPDPIYPTAEKITFLGWTSDRAFAEQGHTSIEDISANAYSFDTPVTSPLTLYAVWAKEQSENRTVTVRNDLTDELTVTATLPEISSTAGITLADGIITDANGQATFTLPAGKMKNLKIPNSAKLVLTAPDGSSCIAYSPTYTDSDSDNQSFTIDTVDRDGTVAFIAGICKITDSDGKVLYDGDGKPAVYMRLDAAFTSYNGTLYADAARTTEANPVAVKMLVDEYGIKETAAIPFPNKTMTLTTASVDDRDFPYAGLRDRSTIRRTEAGADVNCFTLESGNENSNITLTNIILDGGSKQNVRIKKDKNGGLVNISAGTLTVDAGTTIRNVEFKAYDDGNNSRGGAIYMTNGALNVKAGLFTDLHAYQGGAICVTGGDLSIEGAGGSTRFENCYSERQDGGAIYYNAAKDMLINGGDDKKNPGIIFTGCEAKYTNGTSDAGDGGAIFATTNYSNSITVKGCAFIECRAKTNNSKSTSGYGGGGICAYKVKGLTVSACTFEACDTLCGGGAVVAYVKYTETVDNETVGIDNCSFNSCNSKSQGGALAIYQDGEKKTNSATKLTIARSGFANCSSGTNNGSGGAIQCYLPRLIMTGTEDNPTTFEDCWAGKEGGAINHFFGENYAQVWPKSELRIDYSRFIGCRAEDRYQQDQPQHYGGGVNSKAQKVNVANSYFEDCVSTLREGGALHLGGEGDNSEATIKSTTFKNCMAKNGGGAVLASTFKLVINESFFYGCSTSASNGGAVYHYRNSREDSTQNITTITGCTFSANPQDSASQSCSAAQNGGAVWTRAKSVEINKCTIDGCIAGANGGGIYLKKKDNQTSQTATISGIKIEEDGKTIIIGEIKNCQAAKGSAVYVEDKATFSGDLSISENSVSDINDGAVHGGKLYFEGNVQVKDNTCRDDSTYDHDVLLQNNNNTTIYTTGGADGGLSSEAHIGVYVADINSAYANHGKEGQPFGTYGDVNGNAYLESFFNDRDDGLYGYQEKNDGLIYWGRYLCKITDAAGNTLIRPNGKDAVYQSLKSALDEFTQVKDENGETGKAVYIKMLVENYNVFQTGQIDNFPAADITLTTETHTEAEAEEIADGKYPYRGTAGTVCTITRSNSNNQLFKLDNADTTFQLENITLDGRNTKTNAQGEINTRGDFRMIEVANGSLVVNGGTTFQYGSSNYAGGAIYVGNTSANLEIHSSENADVLFDHCTHTANNDYGGGAIYAKSSVTIDNEKGGKVVFKDCTAKRGGAIMLGENNTAGASLSVTGAEFDNCHSESLGGAIYHKNDDNESSSTTIRSSTFTNCHLTGNNIWSYGGAVNSKTANLTVDDCYFKDCYAQSNGGAVNHGGNETNKIKTVITNTTFEDCKTVGTDTGYGYGGSVSTGAITVEISGCAFKNSTATNHGGALYCQSNADGSVTTVSGTTFSECSTTRTNAGCGGAIYSNGKKLTIQDRNGNASSISNCTATDKSGAVYMAGANSELDIKGNTFISGCYAKLGGAVYLKSGVTMSLSNSPEFTRNGYTTQNDSVVNAENGACIYLAQGSRINLQGSPRFSRNNITDQGTNARSRITNGGVLDYVRQDLYLAGYRNMDAASIHVEGELTGDAIWVWPEQTPHKLSGEQFAMTVASSGDVSAESLAMLRNALPDADTSCSNGEYLAGVRLPDKPNGKVFWSKMYVVSFKKIDNKAVAVPGAEFTIYEDIDCPSKDWFKREISADGEHDTDAFGAILPKGTVEFMSVPIGVYYMKETDVPDSFQDNETKYLMLVGTPYLKKNDANRDLWENNGPLDVPNNEILVQRCTTDTGKYYGIFALRADGKADLSKNLASANTGIVNVRDDYEAYFMKTDSAGDPLPNAAFRVYAQKTEGEVPQTYSNGYPVLEPWSRDGENYPAPVKSADGTSAYKKLNGDTVPKGMVYFRELPIGTYYLVETDYPDRNGDNRISFYVEEDRVFKLDIQRDDATGEVSFTMSEWQEDGTYLTMDPEDGYYQVRDKDAVCKLTTDDGALLYRLGHDGQKKLPALYPTLEAGFTAAKADGLIGADGQPAEDDSALKLQVLKDFTIDEPITYSGSRPLTFTTAERTAKEGDKYVFITTRTSDTSRAEIMRNTGDNTKALITISDEASLTLQGINLNGQKSQNTGRAIHVSSGSLSILDHAQLQNFAAGSAGDGGAVLMDDGTSLTIDGGYNRSAVFADNEAVDGGAISIGNNCALSIVNAQFIGNSASEDGGNGGAVYAESDMSLMNTIIRDNTAAYGSALYLEDGINLTVANGTEISGNKASSENGGAINGAGKNNKFYFAGNPVVYDNVGTGDASMQQKNVVLSEDWNEIINTTDAGLLESAKIGVYVIDGEERKIFTDHGLPMTPFGTFVATDATLNLASFTNDRDENLYGMRNEDDPNDMKIYWSVPEGSSEVILRKVSSGFEALDGVVFEIHKGGKYGALVEDTDSDGNTITSFVSDANGVYYVGNLPYGTYYLHETKIGDTGVDIWFILTVNENGVGYRTTDGTIIDQITPEP